jgi:hypothetical protein
MLQCKQLSKASDRGFHGRPRSIAPSTAAGTDSRSTQLVGSSICSSHMTAEAVADVAFSSMCPPTGSTKLGGKEHAVKHLRQMRGNAHAAPDICMLPQVVLHPWSDDRQDLQLALLMMLMSSCSIDAESIAEYGLEAVTQQVGSFVMVTVADEDQCGCKRALMQGLVYHIHDWHIIA